MKLQEQYIDRVINDTINEAYENGFQLRRRFKNGVHGYNVGRKYQNQVDDFLNPRNLNALEAIFRIYHQYYKYYYDKMKDYGGDNIDIQILVKFTYAISIYIFNIKNGLVKCNQKLENKQTVSEGIGNRLKGFAHGFSQNYNYDDVENDENLQQFSEEFNSINKNAEEAVQIISKMDYRLDNLIQKYSGYQSCAKWVAFFNHIKQLNQKAIKTLNSLIADVEENDSKLVKGAIKVGRGLKKGFGKVGNAIGGVASDVATMAKGQIEVSKEEKARKQARAEAEAKKAEEEARKKAEETDGIYVDPKDIQSQPQQQTSDEDDDDDYVTYDSRISPLANLKKLRPRDGWVNGFKRFANNMFSPEEE